MGIFDNAKSILIGDKDVKSIEVDGGSIWEKEVEPPTVKFVICDGFEEKFEEITGGVLSDYYIGFFDKNQNVITYYEIESQITTDVRVDDTSYYVSNIYHNLGIFKKTDVSSKPTPRVDNTGAGLEKVSETYYLGTTPSNPNITTINTKPCSNG